MLITNTETNLELHKMSQAINLITVHSGLTHKMKKPFLLNYALIKTFNRDEL